MYSDAALVMHEKHLGAGYNGILSSTVLPQHPGYILESDEENREGPLEDAYHDHHEIN